MLDKRIYEETKKKLREIRNVLGEQLQNIKISGSKENYQTILIKYTQAQDELDQFIKKHTGFNRLTRLQSRLNRLKRRGLII